MTAPPPDCTATFVLTSWLPRVYRRAHAPAASESPRVRLTISGGGDFWARARAGRLLVTPAETHRGEPDLWAASLPVWPHLAYLGVVPTAVAYALYILGLRTTSATAASIGALLEPLTATLLGVVFFGESLGATGLVGAILLIGAVTLLCVSPAHP
jgi:threonine/homoserine efflux transporter RhtA